MASFGKKQSFRGQQRLKRSPQTLCHVRALGALAGMRPSTEGTSFRISGGLRNGI
jgi:hypothetical protein